MPVSEETLQTAMEHGIPTAVREHGVTYASIYGALKRRGLRHPTHRTAPDARLAEAARFATPGLPWTQAMVGEAMGLHRRAVGYIEEAALKRVRKRLLEKMTDEEKEMLDVR